MEQNAQNKEFSLHTYECLQLHCLPHSVGGALRLWAGMMHRFCLGSSASSDCLKNHIKKDSEATALKEMLKSISDVSQGRERGRVCSHSWCLFTHLYALRSKAAS